MGNTSTSNISEATTQQNNQNFGNIDMNNFEEIIGNAFISVNQALNQALNESRESQKKTVPKDAINNFEKFTYNSQRIETISEQKPNDTTETCPICLDQYEQGNELIKLPCSHYFHESCVTKWLGEHSNTCPCCRKRFCEEESEISSSPQSNDNRIPITPILFPIITANSSTLATIHVPIGFQQIQLPNGNIVINPIFTSINFQISPNQQPTSSTTPSQTIENDPQTTHERLQYIILEYPNQRNEQIQKVCSSISISALKQYLNSKGIQYQSHGLEKRDLAEIALNSL